MQKQNLVVGTGNGSASSTGSGIGLLLRVYRVQTMITNIITWLVVLCGIPKCSLHTEIVDALLTVFWDTVWVTTDVL